MCPVRSVTYVSGRSMLAFIELERPMRFVLIGILACFRLFALIYSPNCEAALRSLHRADGPLVH